MPQADPGVVDQHVEPPNRRLQVVKGLDHLIDISHIGRDQTADPRRLGLKPSQRRLVAVERQDLGPFLQKTRHGGRPNAASRARHQHSFSSQSAHLPLLKSLPPFPWSSKGHGIPAQRLNPHPARPPPSTTSTAPVTKEAVSPTR